MVCNAAGVGVLPYPLFLRKDALKSCQIVHLEGAEPLVARASLLDKFCGEGGGPFSPAAGEAVKGPLFLSRWTFRQDRATGGARAP